MFLYGYGMFCSNIYSTRRASKHLTRGFPIGDRRDKQWLWSFRSNRISLKEFAGQSLNSQTIFNSMSHIVFLFWQT